MRRPITAAYYIERSIANRLGLAEYPCACTRCGGGLVKKVHIVERHHRLYGRDPYLTYLVMTVDGRNVRGPATPSHPEEETYRRAPRDDSGNTFTWPRGMAMDLENIARDAFGRVDDIHDDVLNGQDKPVMDADNIEDDGQWNEVNLEYLVRESSERVFEGSSQNRL